MRYRHKPLFVAFETGFRAFAVDYFSTLDVLLPQLEVLLPRFGRKRLFAVF